MAVRPIGTVYDGVVRNVPKRAVPLRSNAKRNTAETVHSGATRRAFIWALGTGVVALGVNTLPKVEQALDSGEKLLAKLAIARRRVLDKVGLGRDHRLGLLTRLMRSSGRVHLIAPQQHPQFHRPGPHDFSAMATAAAVLRDSNPIRTAYRSTLTLTDTLFSPGSPISSELAAEFVPVFGQPISGAPPLVVKPSMIPYHFLRGREPVYSKECDGEWS
jgi:hypothetical protein